MTMDEPKFRLILSGNLIDGFQQEQVAEALARLLKLPPEQTAQMLNGERSRIKVELSLEKAEHLRDKLQERGAECSVEPIIPRKSDSPETAIAADAPSPVQFDPEESLELDLPEDDSFDAETQMISGASEEPSDFEVVLESPAPIAVEKPVAQPADDEAGTDSGEESGIEQFFEQPRVVRVQQETGKTRAGTRNVLMLALLGVVVLGAGAWFALPYLDGDSQEAGKEQSVATANTPPKKKTKPEITQDRMEKLSRSARVWMIRFGSGFDPTQVTLERLAQDLQLPAEEMTDAWDSPLRYRVTETGYQISSAGADGKFDTRDDLQKDATVQ